jgi:hypothetical protein
VLDEAGNRVWRGRCTTDPVAIAATVHRYAPSAARIGLETGPRHKAAQDTLPQCLSALPIFGINAILNYNDCYRHGRGRKLSDGPR